MNDSRWPVGLGILLSVVCSACGGGSGSPDAGDSVDASTGDTSVVDGGPADEGVDGASDDGAVPDAGAVDEGVDAPPTHARLTVVFDGDGHGNVTSVDPALTCSASCTADFPIGTTLSLVATREDDSTFDEFAGPCGGGNGTCELTLDADVTVHVGFDAIHNYVFVTRERFAPASLGSAVNADALCNAAAEAGDPRLHGRTYVAWMSDSSSDARDRLGDASGWQRLDGLPFIASRETMLGSSTARVLYPPRLDEHGVDVLPPADTPQPNSRPLYFATGIAASGQVTQNCEDWSVEQSNFVGGTADSAGAGWTTELGSACSIDVRLVCLGADYATPFTTPQPPTEATRAVFLTSVPESLRGDGLAALDARCQDQAGAAGLTGTYLALLATPGASALSRFSAEGGPWVRMDGVVAIRDPGAFLVSGVPDSALGTFGRDGEPTTGVYATGASSLTALGTNETTCSSYTSTLTTDGYSFSQAGRTYPVAMGTSGGACSNFPAIVCMAQ